jgi:hypothetical protein
MKIIQRVGFAGIALAILLGTATSASAAGPSVKLTPNVNLRNGEVIRVNGSGFTPGSIVGVVMSNEGQTDVLGAATVTANGSFVTRVKVLTGLGAGAGCGMSATTLRSCILGIGAASGPEARVVMNFRLNTVNGILVSAESN